MSVPSFEALLARLEALPSGTPIPKPTSPDSSRIHRWGVRRGERAIVYAMPNHSNPAKPHQKGVTVAELRSAYARLVDEGTFTRDWFERNLSECAREGACNFTTIGGLFGLLGVAEYLCAGTYGFRYSG